MLSVTLRNADTILGMGMLDHTVDRWQKRNHKVLDLQTAAGSHAGLIRSVTKTLRISLQVAIYGTGAYLAIQNRSTPGIMIAASIIMGRALQPIESCMSTWRNTVEVRGAYRRLKRLFQMSESTDTMTLPKPKGHLRVDGVSLTLQDRYLLRNINFELNPGEQLGIIGPSAAGKSTLCRMLLGLWPSMAGKIRLDGADVFQWDKSHLGRFIGYLPQTVELLPGTVAENIARMGEVDSRQVVKAAEAAGAHQMILGLPQGYDTRVTDGGMSLSGGQTQLIGLARALYGDPCLVILDEPYTSLDQTGAACLKRVLQELKARDASSIIVAHDLSYLKSADKVMVMKDGAMMMYGPKTKVMAPQDQPRNPQRQSHNG